MANTSPLDLGKAPIPKLLLHYALPSIIAMTASSLYNIVDSIFIGHGVGAMGISALAISLPLMNLGAAFGALIGVGASALLSIKMGEGDVQSQFKILGNTLTLNILLGVIYTVVGLWFLDPILTLFGASEHTLPYARQFMRIILIGNIFTHIYLGLNTLLRASGHPRHSMVIVVMAVVVNAILNALFIFVFRWGIAGAAWATVTAQLLATLFEIAYFSRKSHPIHFKAFALKLDGHIVRSIFAIGMAPFLLNIGSSIVVVFLNNVLMQYGGDLYVGAFGIANRILMVIAMITFGLTQGMQPIVGFNYGARHIGRVKQVVKLTIAWATICTTAGTIGGVLFPRTIATIFTTDAGLIDIAENGLRIVFIGFPIVGFQIVCASFFQSIGMASRAVIQSVLRQMVLLLPFLFIFPKFWGTTGIWASMPASDILASLVSAILIASEWRKLNRLALEAKKQAAPQELQPA
ncbi:MATE family efflux transporter [uncultured Acetobacteroides sp.]|uniref:MATE family efflux transporter n=1 Tax=uncultured Acetobacteroides sp. TaxID=1760811 RepID=UPI0029F4EDB5|nr:MATE family efflux transporter [uncultured Acetobacteroides sp.]